MDLQNVWAVFGAGQRRGRLLLPGQRNGSRLCARLAYCSHRRALLGRMRRTEGMRQNGLGA